MTAPVRPDKQNMSILIHALDRCSFASPFDFDGSPPTAFSRPRARLLLLCARLVYENPETIKEVIQSPGWDFDPVKDFAFLSRENTQLFLLKRGEDVFLSFRGTETENFWDWRIDADVTPTLDPVLGADGGLVHRGFSEALGNIWPDLCTTLSVWGQGAPLSCWITGHSLGAALAELAAVRLARHFSPKSVKGAYTFGKPRVGDATFARLVAEVLPERTFWLANHLDLVPRLPPESWGYALSDKLIYINEHHAFAPPEEWLAEVPGLLAQQLERTTRLFRSEPMAILAKKCDEFRPDRIWSGMGKALKKIPTPVLERLKALIPRQILDHFPSEYLKALS